MTTSTTTTSRRSAATQAAVDRYAAHPAAKRARSLQLAEARGLTTAARAIVIERDAHGVAQLVVSAVPSASEPDAQHIVIYDAVEDAAHCDCAAGKNGLACGHAGAALLAGRAAARYVLVAIDYHSTLVVEHTGAVVSL
jgi:hypothetical protein